MLLEVVGFDGFRFQQGCTPVIIHKHMHNMEHAMDYSVAYIGFRACGFIGVTAYGFTLEFRGLKG